MTVQCPHCGSFNVRPSVAYTWSERISKVLGTVPVRCRDCDKRFSWIVWDMRNALYARCPRCYRQDLSTWDLSHYRAPGTWRFLMAFGARRHRCEACRVNFIGFRPAKAKYVRRQSSAKA